MREVLKRSLVHLGVGAMLFALALVFLWPLPLTGGNEIIGGDGDPLLELWTLCWNDHWFSGAAPSYFDANICHPEKNSLAFADHLFSQALFFIPLYRLTGNPVLSYNLLLALSLTLSGWGVWFCARSLGLSRPASLAAGILFAFFPYRTAQIKHLHILSTQWLPFCFYFLLSFLRAGRTRWRPLTLFTLFSVLQVLCSFYQALIWTLLTCGTVAAFSFGMKDGRRKAAGLLCAGLVIATALAPFVPTYFEVSRHYDLVRSTGENIKFSARPGDFLHPSHYTLLHRSLFRLLPPEPSTEVRAGEHQLYPGLVFTLLLACGLCAVVRAGPALRPHRRTWILLLLTAGAALIFSLGPGFFLDTGEGRRLIPLPYALLYHWVPGVQGLRVPARLVLLFHFSGALLAGLGLQRILAGKTNARAWSAALLLALLVLMEAVSLQLPAKPLPLPSSMSPSYRDIAAMPEGTVLLELPTHAKHHQYLPMYCSTFHFHPLAIGRSGIIPPVTEWMYRVSDQTLPHGLGPAFLDHMINCGVNTVLLHRNWSTMKTNQLILDRLSRLDGLEPVTRYKNRDVLYRLDALQGQEKDVAPLDGILVEPGPGDVLLLHGRNAFPSTLNRPVKMTREGQGLRFRERVHFRWLTRIPRGDWQLVLELAHTGSVANGDVPLSLSLELAGVELINIDDLRGAETLEGIPVAVGRAAHYRINCLVQANPAHQPFDLLLKSAKLVPLSREGLN